MKTIDIKGKNYVMVNERVLFFRERCPDYSLRTEILKLENGLVCMKASVFNEDGVEVSTGHAYEVEGSTFINQTSHVENCETSAVGRALGNLGIGIDTSIASAEEVTNAVANQDKPSEEPEHATGKQVQELRKLGAANGLIEKDLLPFMEFYREGDRLSFKEAVELINNFKQHHDFYLKNQEEDIPI